jgi:hypothetical protein
VLDTVTLLVVMGGLYFAWDQAEKFNFSQNLSNWSDVTARTFDIDKAFVDNPKFQKYFYNGVDIGPADHDYPKAYALAVLFLDYFDSVMSRLDYNRGRISGNILQEPAWDRYFDATFKTSPLMCKILLENSMSYGTEMRHLGVPTCKSAFPER